MEIFHKNRSVLVLQACMTWAPLDAGTKAGGAAHVQDSKGLAQFTARPIAIRQEKNNTLKVKDEDEDDLSIN